MTHNRLKEAMLEDIVGDVGRIYKGVKELPAELTKALEPALNHLTATAKTTTDIFQKAKEASETAAYEAEAETRLLLARREADLIRAVREGSIRVAKEVVWKRKLHWALGSLVGAAVVLGGIFSLAYGLGRDTGYRSGYITAYGLTVNQQAADAWANTTQGKMAQALGEVGSIERLYLCDQPGWKVEGEFCIPWAEKKKAPLGWRLLPPSR